MKNTPAKTGKGRHLEQPAKRNRFYLAMTGALMASTLIYSAAWVRADNNAVPSDDNSYGVVRKSCPGIYWRSGTLAQWLLGAGPYYKQGRSPSRYGTYSRQAAGGYGTDSSQASASQDPYGTDFQQETTTGGDGSNLARAGAIGATATAVPDMIGDNSFSGGNILGFGFFPQNAYRHWIYPDPDPPIGPNDPPPDHDYDRERAWDHDREHSIGGNIPSPIASLTRLNMAENFNAEVQNRIYFDYRHFHNVGTVGLVDQTRGGAGDPDFVGSKKYNVDRYTLGFEKKFTRNASIEIRLPIVSQLGTEQVFEGQNLSVPTYDSKIGNMSLVYKQVLRRSRNWTFTGGLGLNVPTAPDTKYDFSCVYDDTEFGEARINVRGKIMNQECRLLPYFAMQWHPSRRTFGHFLAQIDVPLNKNDVDFDVYSVYDGETYTNQGKTGFSDRTMLRLNGSIGHWLYVDDRADLLNRLGALFEVHYSTNLNGMTDQRGSIRNPEGATILSYNYVAPRDGNGNRKKYSRVINLVVGVPMQFGKTSITPSIAVPVTDARYFSTEVSLMVNRRF